MERERDEAQKELSSIYAWIERNHPDGFIDSLTFAQNLERVVDHWYDRFDKVESERDEARRQLENLNATAIHSCHNECQRPMCVLRRERDEARAVAGELADVASKHLSFLLAVTPAKTNETHEKETMIVIDAIKRWKKL
jgi:alpha-L-fucosidase